MTPSPPFEVQFLGTGEAFGPHPNTSILINGEILLDCGFTTFFQLRKAKIALEEIKCIFLSHLHADHTFSIPAFLVASLEEQRERPLEIFSVERIKKYIEELLDLAYGKSFQDLSFKVNVHRAVELHTLDRYLLSFAPITHSTPSLAVAVESEGIKVTYLGDGTPTTEAEELAKKSDLLIAEAYKEDVNNHSSPLKAARLAKRAKVKQLALVHIYRGGAPSIKDAKEVFPRLLTPRDLQKVTLT